MMRFAGHDAGPRGTAIENDFLWTLSVLRSRLVRSERLAHRSSTDFGQATDHPGRLSFMGYGVPWRPSPRPRANRDWLDHHEASSSGRRIRARSSSPR